MYAVIKRTGSQYELQLKPELYSKIVSHCEISPDAELLKMSLTADWKECSQKNIVCYAKIY